MDPAVKEVGLVREGRSCFQSVLLLGWSTMVAIALF